MTEAASPRQCDHCYFCRRLAETLHCVRNPPTADPATGQARWPIVQPTDRCGAFCHDAPNPNQKSKIKNQKSEAPAPNHKSQIKNHKCPPGLPVYRDAFGDYCKIPLTQGRFAKVDPEDYLWLSQFRWSAKIGPHAIYAVRTIQVAGRSKRIYMHRQIMNTPADLVCDHVNHDGLDDRKANLRNCTFSQNNANRRCSPRATSRYLGVSWDKHRNKWAAAIKKDGISKNLGLFDSEEAAARAYDTAARSLHGIYANLNFPEEWPDHPANRGCRPQAGDCRVGSSTHAENHS